MAADNDTPPAGENVSEEQHGNHENGARVADIGSTQALTLVKAPSADAYAEIDVHGEWLDDEQGHVILKTYVGGAEIEISLNPDDADELAAKISSAAAYADGGDR